MKQTIKIVIEADWSSEFQSKHASSLLKDLLKNWKKHLADTNSKNEIKILQNGIDY